jgi:3-oxoacyl-[acyl-carrier protein] reductase
MQIGLEQKVALVTGATRGIGQAIAQRLAKMGAIVIGTATTEQGATQISEQLQQLKVQGQGMVLDISDPNAITEIYQAIGDTYGAPAIIVNNAGITQDNLLLRMQTAQWEQCIQTNLTGAFHICRAGVKAMLKARWGRIINISSVVGITGNAGQANYAATKAGLIGFSKSLAQELGTRGITVNVIAPGFIDTQMTQSLPATQRQKLLDNIPLGRLGQVEDIASAVAFLASNEANYITGQTLQVNGGLNMS